MEPHLTVAAKTYMGLSENSGFSPQIIHFNGVFPDKPSILRVFPLFLETPIYGYYMDPTLEVEPGQHFFDRLETTSFTIFLK